MNQQQLKTKKHYYQESNNKSQENIIPSDSIELRKDNYGEHFYSHLLKEYNLYVEMMDRTSARRGQINRFYTTLLSAMLTLIFTLSEKSILPIDNSFLLFLSAILGLSLCFVWVVNINSCKQLNSLKFKVINEMEQYLPYPCYTREWQILKQESNNNTKYRRLTQVEKYVPLILAVPYFLLLFYSIIQIFVVLNK